MRRLTLAAFSLLIASPAFAQSNGELSDRLDRLERDLNYVQKQVYTGGSSGGAPASAGAATAQFGALQEEIRSLRGQLEQAQYEARSAKEALEKFRGDADYRLQALEQQAAAQQQAAALAAEAAAAAPTEPTDASEEPASYQKEEKKPARETNATGKDFPNSNAHYNQAFKLLDEKNYTAAAASFDKFVKNYPDDPLTANAYYWLGESYYARGDYTRAAEGFRKGFETNPDGQKAPDNLLKLAMSLSKVKRVNEACIVLKQVKSKYGESSPRTATKATQEYSTLQCK